MAKPKKINSEEDFAQSAAGKETYIHPVIRSNGESHIFEELDEAGEMPILTSVGYARVYPNSKDFVSYVIKSKGREVLSIEPTEPNLKAIALDNAKTSFVYQLMDVEET